MFQNLIHFTGCIESWLWCYVLYQLNSKFETQEDQCIKTTRLPKHGRSKFAPPSPSQRFSNSQPPREWLGRSWWANQRWRCRKLSFPATSGYRPWEWGHGGWLVWGLVRCPVGLGKLWKTMENYGKLWKTWATKLGHGQLRSTQVLHPPSNTMSLRWWCTRTMEVGIGSTCGHWCRTKMGMGSAAWNGYVSIAIYSLITFIFCHSKQTPYIDI